MLSGEKNGERSKLQLLQLGLDRYLPGEEGLALHRQQAVEGAKDYAGFPGHFPSSLAKGLDEHEPRTFREVYEILKQYYILSEKNRTGEERERMAAELAWKSCVRRFRGTTGATPGAIFTKDIVYREGNIETYELINRKDHEQHRFMVGKYDPSNERHRWILDQLGISEADLENLAE